MGGKTWWRRFWISACGRGITFHGGGEAVVAQDVNDVDNMYNPPAGDGQLVDGVG